MTKGLSDQFCLVIGLCLVLSLASGSARAWDATGHRLGAYVAWEFLEPATRTRLLETLRQHPRFEQDFEDMMPDFIRAMDRPGRERWLFGQAAVWPDHVRGLPDGLRERYNRPDWHWIDGRWVRGRARMRGNVHVLTPPREDIVGRDAGEIRGEQDADNVVLALEHARLRLHDGGIPAEDRAVALCWVLHLAADLHQPLHTGALVSGQRFPEGDRGGNLIDTTDGNLHAVWDSALSDLSFEDTLEDLLGRAREFRGNGSRALNPDTELWLQESRRLLHRDVYTESIRNTVREHDGRGGRLPELDLNSGYRETMQRIARRRLALSGARLARALADDPAAP